MYRIENTIKYSLYWYTIKNYLTVHFFTIQILSDLFSHTYKYKTHSYTSITFFYLTRTFFYLRLFHFYLGLFICFSLFYIAEVISVWKFSRCPFNLGPCPFSLGSLFAFQDNFHILSTIRWYSNFSLHFLIQYFKVANFEYSTVSDENNCIFCFDQQWCCNRTFFSFTIYDRRYYSYSKRESFLLHESCLY